MTRPEIQQALLDFVLESFPAARTADLTVDSVLLDRGIIDSMGVLELVVFLEERFQLTLDDEEMLPEHFMSIPTLAELVDRKLTAGRA